MGRSAGVLLAALGGCGGSTDFVSLDYDLLPLAGGASIDRVTLNQGVEKRLYLAPGFFSGGRVPPPVLEGRDALVRVGISPADEDVLHRPVAVVAKLTSERGEVSLGQVMNLGDTWSDEDPTSTANFVFPSSVVGAGAELEVTVRDPRWPDPIEGDTDEATWSSADDPLDVVPTDALNLVIVPVQYSGDGSGRLPDTSPAQVEAIRSAFLAMYPVSSVEVTVAPPLPWGRGIGAFTGWETLLDAISDLRVEASVPENTYYYGLFSPAANEAEFCQAGCVLGLSYLAFAPTDTWARASIGVGWSGELAINTMLHEVGHAHGRDHAPCGVFGDAQFPYPDAELGAWGYDRRDGSNLDPRAHHDVMSYCGPIWTSDYTYDALYDRVDALRLLAAEASRRSAARVPWQVVRIDGAGEGTFVRTIQATDRPGGDPVVIELESASGERSETSGFFVPYDHLPGGTALIPPVEPGIRAARAAWVSGGLPTP